MARRIRVRRERKTSVDSKLDRALVRAEVLKVIEDIGIKQHIEYQHAISKLCLSLYTILLDIQRNVELVVSSNSSTSRKFNELVENLSSSLSVLLDLPELADIGDSDDFKNRFCNVDCGNRPAQPNNNENVHEDPDDIFNFFDI